MMETMQAAIDRLAARFPAMSFAAALGPPTEPLTDEESALAARYAVRRRVEFTLGRQCARQALRKMGVKGCSLLPNVDGSVSWPAGVIGSLSHKHAGSVAVVARASTVGGLGIDLESADATDSAMAERIATEREQQALAELGKLYAAPVTLLFACKEAVYKAQFRRHRRELDWADVEIQLDDVGAFLATMRDASSVFVRGAVETEGNWVVAFAIETER